MLFLSYAFIAKYKLSIMHIGSFTMTSFNDFLLILGQLIKKAETAMQNAQRAQSKIKGKKLEGAFLFYYYHNIILLYVTCKLK